MKNPNIIPIKGDSTIKMAILNIPEATRASPPNVNHTGPINPPDQSVGHTDRHTEMSTQPNPDHRTDQSCQNKIFIDFRGIHDSFCPSCEPRSPQKIKIAAKFQNAAQQTAIVGENTRVATIVAIELAASFIPFKKSKRRAITIAKRTIVNIAIRQI